MHYFFKFISLDNLFKQKKKKNINLNFSATVIYIKAQWLANLVPASQIPIYHFIPLHMNHFSHSFLSLHLPAKLSVQQHYLTHTTESLEKNKEGKHKLIFHSMSSQVYTWHISVWSIWLMAIVIFNGAESLPQKWSSMA